MQRNQPCDYDAAIDRAISTCNGDLRGAVKALLIVNELLETELASLRSAKIEVSHDRAA